MFSGMITNASPDNISAAVYSMLVTVSFPLSRFSGSFAGAICETHYHDADSLVPDLQPSVHGGEILK